LRQLRVENTLYNLTDEVWRQVNDLLGKAEGRTHLTQEMLKDEIPLETEESGDSKLGLPAEDEVVSHETSEEAKPLGENLSGEDKP